MRKVTAFNFITINGCFKGPKGDISWHRHGAEENQYGAESLKSGNVFAEQGLIDEYQIMVDPVVLGAGTPIMKGIKHKPDLKLTGTRRFKSGVVLLSYRPVEKRYA